MEIVEFVVGFVASEAAIFGRKIIGGVCEVLGGHHGT